MTTSVPGITFTLSGPVAPQEAAILAGVLADLNAAFGGKLNITNLQTPQGQIAQSETAIIGGVNDNWLFVMSQADPATAEGIWQDAIGFYYFLQRLPAVPTKLQVSCMGASGLAIPAGTTLQDSSGNIYAATAGGIIAGTGSVTLEFDCTVTGPTPVPGLLTISPTVGGFDSATVVSGVTGNVVESQQAFELRRQQTVAANSSQMIQSVQGALLSIPVASAYCYDNPINAPVTTGGVTIPANSIDVCVAPGSATPAQIAQAIWSKKGGGCGYYGMSTATASIASNTLTIGAVLTGAVAIGQTLFDTTGVLTGNPVITAGSGTSWTINGAAQTVASETIYLIAAGSHGVQVLDTSNGYQTPYPAYVVAYTIASDIPFAVTVNLKNSKQVPNNVVQLVQTAVANAYAGIGGVAMAIGATVFASNCFAAIAALGPWAQIVSVFIDSTSTPVVSHTACSISGTTLTVSSGTSVAIGQTVLDLTGNIEPGTQIVSGSGTSWQVSLSQTVASETMYFVNPASVQATPNINQFPQLAAGNVGVNLV